MNKKKSPSKANPSAKAKAAKKVKTTDPRIDTKIKSSGKNQGGSPAQGKRNLKVKVKSAKGRKVSSTMWLQRQLNDPYVQRAKDEGFRARAAFKLTEIDDQFDLIKPGMVIVDLGAAPGGWSQVAARRTKSEEGKGQVVAIDISEMEAIQGVEIIHMDFMEDEAPDELKKALKGNAADIVMSDMAAPSTGHRQTDHLRIIGLAEAALEFAIEVLKPEGAFLAKVLQGGTEHELLALMKKYFKKTRHVKPDASRADSSELYVMATGFKGRG